MRDLFGDVPGERLALDDYLADLDRRFAGAPGHDSWKFERRQHFTEPDDASWAAFARGEWADSLRLMAATRDEIEAEHRDAARLGSALYRVRVVEEPIAPYLQWELHLLRLRAECGERIRVVDVTRVAEFETGGKLPELLTVGPDTVYRILYNAAAALQGALRHVDTALTTRCVRFMRRLYQDGEEMTEFFQRRVAGLDAPRS
jgi:hypothetical protein